MSVTSQERVNIPDIYWFQLFYYIKRKRKRTKIRDRVRELEKKLNLTLDIVESINCACVEYIYEVLNTWMEFLMNG